MASLVDWVAGLGLTGTVWGLSSAVEDKVIGLCAGCVFRGAVMNAGLINLDGPAFVVGRVACRATVNESGDVGLVGSGVFVASTFLKTMEGRRSRVRRLAVSTNKFTVVCNMPLSSSVPRMALGIM